MKLTEILTPEKWQELSNDLYDHSSMTPFAFDEQGRLLPGQGNWANHLCPVIQGNPARAEVVCGSSNRRMAETGRDEHSIVIAKCKAGLLKVGVPVFVQDEYLGMVGGCGLLSESGLVDGEVVREATGLEPDVVDKLGEDIVHMGREEVEEAARYMEERVSRLVFRHMEAKPGLDIKTFKDLIEDVQKRGRCHQCGGCMTFCSAMQYGALELSERGRPRFRDVDNCVECGVCYMICPATHMMENQVKKQVEWTPPMGLIQEVAIVRAKDEEIRKRATDGGAVTAILTHLMDKMEIDGAAVTRQLDPFRRQPWLATNREEILESAGSNFDRSHSGSITLYTQDYTTYSPSVKALGPIAKKGLGRVALVGTPCQIMTVRKMETLGVVPSQSIYCTLGLFCSGNYSFGDRRREKIERMGDFKWSDLEKINIKDDLIIRLNNGEVLHIPLDELDFIKRRACQFCDDYGAEYADISFGGIGAEDGWTTVIARTSKGVRILSEAMNTVLEAFPSDKGKSAYGQVLEAVERLSQAKKDNATKHRQEQEEPELEPA